MADTRQQHQELIEKLKAYVEELKSLRGEYAVLRTRLGTSKEKGTTEFYILVEASIDLAGAVITQAENQIIQADVCMDYADGFENRYKLIIDRLGILEAPLKDRAAFDRFLDSKFAKITKYAGYTGIVFTVVSYWADIQGLIP